MLLIDDSDLHPTGTNPPTRHGIALSDQPVEKLEGPWDMLILSHVLEHFPDIDGVLQHLRRLIPNGLCFIEVPHSPHPEHDPPGDVRHYCNTAHTFNFRPRSLQTIFERNGFDVIHMSRWLLNVPGTLTSAPHRAAREMIQSDRSFRLASLPFILIFLLRCGLQPSKSFRRMPLEADWSGKGDNIRLVARPRP